jgi:hypothetical protein
LILVIRRDNSGTKTQQQVSGSGEYTGGDYSSTQSNEPVNESYPQHQISTTVTSHRPSGNSHGANLSSSNSNGNNSNSSGSNSYKSKQQRNYGTNRYDPMGGALTGYQARNAAAAAAAAAQLQGQWNNGVSVPAGQGPYGNLSNAFGVPHHYQQQPVDMYASYYGTTQAASYAGQGPQQANAYGQYGPNMIPRESPKGGHVVYVYGIGQRATQQEILALFQPYGCVLRVDIIIDFNTGLCKG